MEERWVGQGPGEEAGLCGVLEALRKYFKGNQSHQLHAQALPLPTLLSQGFKPIAVPIRALPNPTSGLK